MLAAIYTSEFLSPRAKTRVKPTIEIMASLPSVVLGFPAAMVFAPLVEDLVTERLMAVFTVPFAFLLGASLWQLLPPRSLDGLPGSARELIAGRLHTALRQQVSQLVVGDRLRCYVQQHGDSPDTALLNAGGLVPRVQVAAPQHRFHIYDLGFQSQNSEAAQPMLYTTTLPLILLIALLNVTAMWLRSRRQKRFVGHAF